MLEVFQFDLSERQSEWKMENCLAAKITLSFSLVLGVLFLARLLPTTSFKVAARYEFESGGSPVFLAFRTKSRSRTTLERSWIITVSPTAPTSSILPVMTPWQVRLRPSNPEPTSYNPSFPQFTNQLLMILPARTRKMSKVNVAKGIESAESVVDFGRGEDGFGSDERGSSRRNPMRGGKVDAL